MMSHDLPQLWKHITKQSIWGNRGLIKISSLLLPLSVILTHNTMEIAQANLIVFFQVLLVVMSWLLFSILINDIADSKDDRLSGKMRWIVRITPLLRASILSIFLVGGLGILMLSQNPVSTKWVFIAAVVTGFLYSLKPLRLKERGVWGLFAYSSSCTLGYCVIPWTWLSEKWELLLLLAPTVFLDKWVNLHFHQIVDYESDLKMGTKTYAVLAGPDRARKILKWISWLTSLWLLAVFLYIALFVYEWRAIIILVVGFAVLACAFYIFLSRRTSGLETSLVRELPWTYLGLTYAVLRLLPLVLLVRLSFHDPSMLVSVALTGVILMAESWFFLEYHYE
jgi:4-hydroxybenzoate polyprenyltransferase